MCVWPKCATRRPPHARAPHARTLPPRPATRQRRLPASLARLDSLDRRPRRHQSAGWLPVAGRVTLLFALGTAVAPPRERPSDAQLVLPCSPRHDRPQLSPLVCLDLDLYLDLVAHAASGRRLVRRPPRPWPRLDWLFPPASHPHSPQGPLGGRDDPRRPRRDPQVGVGLGAGRQGPVRGSAQGQDGRRRVPAAGRGVQPSTG